VAEIAAPERAHNAQPDTAIQRTHAQQVKAGHLPTKHRSTATMFLIYRRVHSRSGHREFLVASFDTLEAARDWLVKQATDRRGNGLVIQFPKQEPTTGQTP
jgi:hypothetical protein